jgi:hypothetical protein
MITIAPESPQQMDLFAELVEYQDNFAVDWDRLTQFRKKANPPANRCERCARWTWEGNTVHRWGQCSIKYQVEHSAKLAAGSLLAKWDVDVSGFTLWSESCESFEAAS